MAPLFCFFLSVAMTAPSLFFVILASPNFDHDAVFVLANGKPHLCMIILRGIDVMAFYYNFPRKSCKIFQVSQIQIQIQNSLCIMPIHYFWDGLSVWTMADPEFYHPYVFTLLLFPQSVQPEHITDQRRCTHRSTFKLSAALPSRKAHLSPQRENPLFTPLS